MLQISFMPTVVASLLVITTAFANANEKEKIRFQVEKFQLKNGLTVLVHEDHTRPIISYQQWFRVGSSHEKPGRTGLAHFFEHLMFKGTKKYPKGVIDQIIQKNGGSNNAFTTEDYTGYYTNLPSDKLELIIDIEADRMTNLVFDINEINSEREVVKEERRMRYENNNYGALYEKLRTTIYKTSPYRWPVIGYMADLNAAQLNEFQEFYKKYYSPNNAVVVVAGDVKAGKVKSLIEKYYETIPRQELPPFQPTAEVEQTAPREGVLNRDVQASTIALSYNGVPSGQADVHAIELMRMVLGGGDSSRLYRKLVYKNALATSISASSESNKLAGDIMIFASLQPGADITRAQSLINQEIFKIRNELVSDAELEKAKNAILVSYVGGLKTMHERAQALAINEIYFSDYRKLFEDLEKYEAVKKEDIQRVAQKYFVAPKRTRILLTPAAKSEI